MTSSSLEPEGKEERDNDEGLKKQENMELPSVESGATLPPSSFLPWYETHRIQQQSYGRRQRAMREKTPLMRNERDGMRASTRSALFLCYMLMNFVVTYPAEWSPERKLKRIIATASCQCCLRSVAIDVYEILCVKLFHAARNLPLDRRR